MKPATEYQPRINRKKMRDEGVAVLAVTALIEGIAQIVVTSLHSRYAETLDLPWDTVRVALVALGSALALARSATASHDNSFVFSDVGGGSSAADNTFNVHASGGIYLDGVSVHSSDRDKKTDFKLIEPADVLDRVAALPISSWRFKAEDPGVRHIGPTAQDFKAAFDLGSEDRYIADVDINGVALAAIQALNAKLDERDAAIAALRAEVAELKQFMRDADR